MTQQVIREPSDNESQRYRKLLESISEASETALSKMAPSKPRQPGANNLPPPYSRLTGTNTPLRVSAPVADPTNARAGQAGKTDRTEEILRWLKEVKASHLWFLFWNLATLTLAICVLSGCGARFSTSYTLFSYRGSDLVAWIGDENCEFCDFQKVPDVYLFGLSGKMTTLCVTTRAGERHRVSSLARCEPPYLPVRLGT